MRISARRSTRRRSVSVARLPRKTSAKTTATAAETTAATGRVTSRTTAAATSTTTTPKPPHTSLQDNTKHVYDERSQRKRRQARGRWPWDGRSRRRSRRWTPLRAPPCVPLLCGHDDPDRLQGHQHLEVL